MNFKELCKLWNIDVTEEQELQFQQYYQFLIKKNEVMNLTTITDEEDVYIKHFLDSLSLSKVVDLKDQSILDVGSGAGFPSIPLKIVFPNLKITIVDALQKRIVFLEELVQLLGLNDVSLIHIRAEDFKKREQFDIVTGRAVANLQVLSELCIPFVKVHGFFVAMKSRNYLPELENAESAIHQLGAKYQSVIAYSLPGDIENVLLVIQKNHPTNTKYPRIFSKIKNNPL